MPRHTSPASSSLRYLAASDFDLIVGGAGRQEALSADPYLPGGGMGGGGETAVVPPMSGGAADGPGFTWPDAPTLDTVDGDLGPTSDGSLTGPPMAAGAADGAGFTWPDDMQSEQLDDGGTGDDAPQMCGTMVPTEAPTDAPTESDVPDDWAETLDSWDDAAVPSDGAAPADSWAGTLDPTQGWDSSGAPMTLDDVDDLVPAKASFDDVALPDGFGLPADVGATQPDFSDVMPYEVNELPVDAAPIPVQADDDGGGEQGGGCHGGDGGGNGDGQGRGGDDDDDDAGDDDGGGVEFGGGNQPDDGNPLSWSNTVSAAPSTPYERPPAAADVNVFNAPQVSPQGLGANAGNLLDWAFSPSGPVASAVGGDIAQNIWGLIGSGGNGLRR